MRRFTLLELLVALVVSAILLSSLLMAAGTAWRRQQQRSAREQQRAPRDAATAQWRRELLAVAPPGGLLSGTFLAETRESGGTRLDTLSFVTGIGGTTPLATAGSLVGVNYELIASEAPGHFDLVRTEERNLLALEADEPLELVLLRDVSAFSVSCYDGSDWIDGWDSSARDHGLPAAIALRCEFAGTDKPEPLTVLLPLALPTFASTEEAGP